MAIKRLLGRIRIAAKQTTSYGNITFSLDPRDTFDALRRHRWRALDAQWLFLLALGAFALSIAQAPLLFKIAFCAGIVLLLIIPILSQFFLPFMPVACWLVFFFSCRFIPASYRPPISVRVLPALENILYGANLSNILAKHTNTVLDVLAWLPYGVIHYAGPFLCAAFLFVFGPPETVPVFSMAFGYMNIIGVLIQIAFPCSPPWYENLYGLAPAHYGMQGSPGGLARIDTLFGGNTYSGAFTASPMVFGAFPSLHSGSATIEALFLAHVFPKTTPYFYGYVLWIWWSTMYLTHHYFVDLIGGSILAASCFYVAHRNFLPQLQPEKLTRFEYEESVKGQRGDTAFTRVPLADDLEAGREQAWALGSMSSSSGRTTPVSTTSGGGSGYSWPVEPNGRPSTERIGTPSPVKPQRKPSKKKQAIE